MTMISAKDVPGVLLQVVFHFFHLRFITNFFVIFTIIFFFTYKASLALGDFYDTAKGLPLQKTKRVQRAIGLFFAVCRASEWDEATEKDVEVQITPKITTKIVANFT